jgi:hypothetical protein
VWQTSGWFQFCNCQLPIYIATSQHHLHMAFIFSITDSICKDLLSIRSVFESG